MDKLRDEYDANIKSTCMICSVKQKVTDLWEPRWQWGYAGIVYARHALIKRRLILIKRRNFALFVVQN